MTSGITPTQLRCLNFIKCYIAGHRCPPTFEEIRVGLELRSKSNVSRYMHSLRERGWLTYTEGRSRSIEILNDPNKGYVLPPKVQTALDAFCATRGEIPDDIVADAVALFIDQNEGVQAA